MNCLRRAMAAGWLVCFAAACAVPAAEESAWFAPAASVAEYRPKGPSHCFRQFNIDWSWIATRPEQVSEFLRRADPAAWAEFCAQTHIDGTIVMAVPHHGYCTYATRVGTKFPGMQGDWFGRTVEELHKRRIAAFGYVTLNWNWKYLREHAGSEFTSGQADENGVFGHRGLICLNAPGYIELVEAYTREVLQNYPVDGMRWDILNTAARCRCAGCKALYRQRYGEDLADWTRTPPGRATDFYLATTDRAVLRLTSLCKRIKPSVEIWQNGLQSYTPNNLDLARQLDVAYNEYGDPFRLLLIRGVADKAAAINGLLNHTPSQPPVALDRRQWRTCLALGGRCYSYYGHLQTDPQTVTPGPAMLAWHRDELAPFYAMVQRIEPWLVGARPVSRIGVVFSEATRFRLPNADRQPYIEPMEALCNAMLARSVPLEFVNRLDLGLADRPVVAGPRTVAAGLPTVVAGLPTVVAGLLTEPPGSLPVVAGLPTEPPGPDRRSPENPRPRSKQIDRFKLLIVPQSSGLSADETACLRRYAERGGTLLIVGDALRHDAAGRALTDFPLADTMGVSYTGNRELPAGAAAVAADGGQSWPKSTKRGSLVQVRAVAGRTLASVVVVGVSHPLLHETPCGRGRVVYLATADAPQWFERIVVQLAGRPTARVDGPADKRVVLTQQPTANRWILHLIDTGPYTVELLREDAAATRVVVQFPAEGWTHRLEQRGGVLRIEVSGQAQDRLLVLE